MLFSLRVQIRTKPFSVPASSSFFFSFSFLSVKLKIWIVVISWVSRGYGSGRQRAQVLLLGLGLPAVDQSVETGGGHDVAVFFDTECSEADGFPLELLHSPGQQRLLCLLDVVDEDASVSAEGVQVEDVFRGDQVHAEQPSRVGFVLLDDLEGAKLEDVDDSPRVAQHQERAGLVEDHVRGEEAHALLRVHDALLVDLDVPEHGVFREGRDVGVFGVYGEVRDVFFVLGQRRLRGLSRTRPLWSSG